MTRYIVTGAPGAGKTAIVRELAAIGYAVVAEAATDVIAAAQARGDDQPWRRAGFPSPAHRLVVPCWHDI